jgi:Uma2 family endonuclease
MTQAILSTTPIERYYFIQAMIHTGDLRHEFVDGVMLAMTGVSPEHAHLAARVIAQLSPQLIHKPCNLYSDLQVRVVKESRVFCPVAVLQCGTPFYDHVDRHGKTLTNPLLVVEVLSSSTQRYDYETKLPSYQSIESLRSIIYVHQQRRVVEVWVKLPSGRWEWNTFESGSFEVIGLSDTVFDVDALYSQTEFAR